MTHDPMCPQYDCWLEGCTVCDECALISRVREDERDNCWSAVAEIYPDELFNGVKTAWWVEKETALAAIDALKEKP